nr:uncharacterized protein LOC123774152 [Procambarus clarkii]
MGHKLSFSSMVYFPYMDYKLSRSDPATTVTLLDSLNVRMIYDFATRLNISFDVREQPERSWGVERGGKFTGMVGELQGEKVDVGAPMGPLAERLNAMDFVNVYKVDFMKILSLKPTLLPEYLSLIRPFSVTAKFVNQSIDTRSQGALVSGYTQRFLFMNKGING